LSSHIRRFATASIRIAIALFVHAALLHHALFAHAYLLHATFLMHTLLFTHSTLIIHTPFIIHSAPVLLSKLLGLLVRVLMGGKCLFVTHGIIATDGSLMHAPKWATDGRIVRMVWMILNLIRRCL
jgi:hypothetical protein